MTVDLETLLPISLIRTHTKTDDVPAVTDELLALYREAAFEVCQQESGLNFASDGYVNQTVTREMTGDTVVHLTQPAVDGIITLLYDNTSQVVTAPPGARELRLAGNRYAGFAMPDGWDGPRTFTQGKCSVCIQTRSRTVVLRYKVAPPFGGKIPADIRQGLLQYIAWSIENPGDVTAAAYASSVTAGAVPLAALKAFRRHNARILF